jgi:hypothetical protein
MIKTSADLLKLSPYPTEDYETYALANLTACSVFLLQEWGLLTSLENISVLSHRLFPTKFAMVGWPKFPDANRTNRSILQMRPKYRNLATSITGKGVFLNDRGIAEAKAILSRLGVPRIGGVHTIKIDPIVKAERGGKRPRTIHAEDLITKLKGSKLFKMFSDSKWSEVEAIDLIGLLGVYDHTPSKEKKRRLSEFKNAAQDLKDAKAMEFIKAIEDSFGKYLSR